MHDASAQRSGRLNLKPFVETSTVLVAKRNEEMNKVATAKLGLHGDFAAGALVTLYKPCILSTLSRYTITPV